MNYAQSLLETVFGGLRPAARALNKPASTIQSWQESGTIPQKHWAEIIRKSAALGHDLTVEDFIDDDLFTAEPTPKGDNQDGHKGDINPTSNPKIPPKTANEMLNFAGYDFNKLHCLTIADFHRVDIETLLQLGSHYLDLSVQKSPRKGPLKGKTLINLFFENSTRTEKSFELAGKRLGADVISMQVASSSVKKGETLLDTASTLNAMNPDLLVVRHSASGAPALLAQKLSCGVINAGDGLHAHPTQALLDALTLRQTLKALGKGDIGGLRIAICGDILHSRVARSNVQLFNMLGAQIHLIAPPTLMPLGAQNWGVNLRSGSSCATIQRFALRRAAGYRRTRLAEP